jgi:hypothetical protein
MAGGSPDVADEQQESASSDLGHSPYRAEQISCPPRQVGRAPESATRSVCAGRADRLVPRVTAGAARVGPAATRTSGRKPLACGLASTAASIASVLTWLPDRPQLLRVGDHRAAAQAPQPPPPRCPSPRPRHGHRGSASCARTPRAGRAACRPGSAGSAACPAQPPPRRSRGGCLNRPPLDAHPPHRSMKPGNRRATRLRTRACGASGRVAGAADIEQALGPVFGRRPIPACVLPVPLVTV